VGDVALDLPGLVRRRPPAPIPLQSPVKPAVVIAARSSPPRSLRSTATTASAAGRDGAAAMRSRSSSRHAPIQEHQLLPGRRRCCRASCAGRSVCATTASAAVCSLRPAAATGAAGRGDGVLALCAIRPASEQLAPPERRCFIWGQHLGPLHTTKSSLVLEHLIEARPAVFVATTRFPTKPLRSVRYCWQSRRRRGSAGKALPRWRSRCRSPPPRAESATRSHFGAG